MCEINSVKKKIIAIIDTLVDRFRSDGQKLQGNRLYYALSIK